MNLTLGSADAATLQLALKRKFTPFVDPMSHGPVRPFPVNSLETWVSRRTSYWTAHYPVGAIDALRFGSEYLRTIDAILTAKAITLWSATDVDGLVLSAWLTFFIRARKTGCQIELVQYPRRAGSCILAMQRDTIMKPPRSVPVTGNYADFLISFWRAWTAPSPDPLFELFTKATSQHSRRFLLSLLLDRYPSAETGLSRWDLTLLRNVRKHGPSLNAVIAYSFCDPKLLFDGAGDFWLRSRLSRLAHPRKKGALVTIVRDDNNPRDEKITLTQLGSDVLAGRANALDTAIRTDWIGGVRIAASNPIVWVRTSDGLAQRSTNQ